MNFNYLLIWTVCLSCIMFLIRAIRSSFKHNFGWVTICSSILVITLIMVYFHSAIAGWIGGILWGIFVLIPLTMASRVNYLVYQQRYGEARRISAYLSWLHPGNRWLKQSQLLRAIEIGQQGNITKATYLIQQHCSRGNSLDRSGQVLIYWMTADWQRCLLWMGENIPQKVLFKDSNLLIYYLRALGESGDVNGLLRKLESVETSLEKSGDRLRLNLVRLYALAFSGQIVQVKQLFNGPLKNHAQNTQKFWLATAQMAAGNQQSARRKLLALRQVNDFILSNAIDWRLCNPLNQVEQDLSYFSKSVLHRLKIRLNQENRYIQAMKLSHRKAYVTYSLLGINLLLFCLEIVLGGSEDLATLYRLGALVPEAISAGQWWRLITANFLHFGWVHLATNMLGLYVLGKLVEANLGSIRYLLVYLISGIGTMLIFSFSMPPNQILVGASAAIMGLLGVILAMFLRDWHKDKSRLAAKRLQLLSLIVGIQFIFDLTTPQVSFLSHLIGLIIGFFTGLILLLKNRS